MHYFIDAHDGTLVQRFNGLHTAVEQASGPGGIARLPQGLDATSSTSTTPARARPSTR